MRRQFELTGLYPVIVMVWICTFVTIVAASSQSSVQVHLPRTIIVDKSEITISDVAVLFGDENLVRTIKPILLGKITSEDQQLVFEKETIKARLVCSGIDAAQLVFSGAQDVTVTRDNHRLAEERIVEAAKAFLCQNPPVENVCYIQPVRQVGDLNLERKPDLPVIKCSYLDGTSANYAKIKVQVFDGLKPIAETEIDFRLKFKVLRAIAAEAIQEGEIISNEKVKIEERVEDQPPGQTWVNPVGMVAGRRLSKGTEIRFDMVQSEGFSVSIKRNENVVIRAEKYGFIVTSVGIALQKGNEGDVIRVRNIDSSRIVSMKINPDGTVSPIL